MDMKAYLLFTGTGPILILTTFPGVTDSRLTERMAHKGIVKFIAYQVSIERTRELYSVPMAVIEADLAGREDVRVLDFNGHHIFANFRLSELSEPIRHGD